MNDEEFNKLMVELQKRSVYFIFGYLESAIIFGLENDPLIPCTKEQAVQLLELFRKAIWAIA